jgi:SAM-dependent methyltransferase
LKNAALSAAGLFLGAANTVRHKRQGYVTPRPFTAAEIDRTIDHAIGNVDRLERAGAIDWAGKRVLELGPGSDLTTGAVILARGAASYVAADLFDNRGQSGPELYARLGERLGATVDVDALGFVQTDFPGLSAVDGEFDVIVSNACLEHVADVGGLFQRLRRLVAAGGLMAHEIDAKAHMRWFREHDPLNHLRYPDPVHDALLDFPGAPNRLRAGDFERLASGAGWRPTVVPAAVARPAYLERTRVARRYRSRDDLALLTFTLVASPA